MTVSLDSLGEEGGQASGAFRGLGWAGLAQEVLDGLHLALGELAQRVVEQIIPGVEVVARGPVRGAGLCCHGPVRHGPRAVSGEEPDSGVQERLSPHRAVRTHGPSLTAACGSGN